MAKQVTVFRRHIGKRRDADWSRCTIPVDEYESEILAAKEDGRDPVYMLDTGDAGGPSFDQLTPAKQEKVLAAQRDRAKLKEIADAEAEE